jgi:ribosome-associated translation inhibitor RaiA
VKTKLSQTWEKKTPRLQKLLASFPNDLQDVRLAVYGHQENPNRVWYELRAAIHLPTGTLSAQEEGDEPLAVLDKIVDALVAEVKKHKEHVRKELVYKRKSRRRSDLTAAGPLLESSTAAGHQQGFFALLRPSFVRSAITPGESCASWSWKGAYTAAK